MYWETEIKREPYHGEQRVITKFAFRPVRTEDGKVRWLEKVSILQTYRIDPKGHWINNCFVELQ